MGIIVERFEFEFNQEDNAVGFFADRVDRHDIQKDDVERVRGLLEDMGKWETVAKAVSDFANAAGLRGTTQSEPVGTDIEPYRVTVDQDLLEGVKGTVHLTPEERHRRSRDGTGKEELLPVQEIVNAMQNVPRWKNLQRALSSLKIGSLTGSQQ